MALQTATTALAAFTLPTYDYTSLTMVAVDAGITAVKATQKYKMFSLDLEMQSNVVMIKQSDDSLIEMDEAVSAIKAQGYECKGVPNGLKVELTVIWE